MTEIVADKTVEVVKNAIETADGALDLYNKYLDQVIPWQTFDETIKELSRFKQEYSQAASVLVGDIKTLLMDSQDKYFEAKASLFSANKRPGFAVFNAEDEKVFEFGKNYNGEKYFFGKEMPNNCSYIKDNAIYFKNQKGEEEKIIDIQDVTLVGNHNYQNIMASLICAKLVGVETQKITEAIKDFKAPEHRCEFVANISGKDVYNDSKATNPEAAIVALKSFGGRTVTLIAGGTDKNTDLTEFCETVKKYVSHVVLLGLAKDRFESELRKNGYDNIVMISGSFQDGVDKAFELPDEVILLSPACSSYDMFSGYEERGKVFKEYALSKK